MINPFLKWKGRFGAEFKIGPSIESIEVEDTANRYINAINYQQEKRKTYIGLQAFAGGISPVVKRSGRLPTAPTQNGPRSGSRLQSNFYRFTCRRISRSGCQAPRLRAPAGLLRPTTSTRLQSSATALASGVSILPAQCQTSGPSLYTSSQIIRFLSV